MLAHPTHACLGRVQVNEGSAEKPKWGWVGTKPGAELHFMLNTTLPPGISPELVGGHVGAPARVIVRGRGGGGGAAAQRILDSHALHAALPTPQVDGMPVPKGLAFVSIAHLRSYEHMGVASERRSCARARARVVDCSCSRSRARVVERAC